MKNAGLEGIFQKATSMVLLPVEKKKKSGKIMDEPIDLANKVYVRKIYGCISQEENLVVCNQS